MRAPALACAARLCLICPQRQGPAIPTPARDKPRDAIDALTSLRFFAAFYVLFLHSGTSALILTGRMPKLAENFLLNGYLGVSFFFVLSGFILTYVYRGAMAGEGAMPRFFLARFARIYPVYLLSLLLLLPLVPCAGAAACGPQFVLLQMWLPLGSGWWQNTNGPAWTLSVELLFYLAFPWLLAALGRLSARQLMLAAMAICALMVAGRLPAISGMDQAAYPFMAHIPAPVLRLPEFAYGICLGLIFLAGSRRGDLPFAPHLAIAATVAALCASRSLWVAPLAAILFGIVIFAVAAWMRPGLLARLLSSRAMVLLGGASYSLYVMQSPVREWVRFLFAGPLESSGRLVFLPLMIAISILVFLWFEEPARALIKAAGRRRASLPAR